ncbi:MAG: acyltransferase [Acidimicrobiales bacterium]
MAATEPVVSQTALPSLTGMRMLAAGAVFFTHIRWVLPSGTVLAVGGHHLTIDRVLLNGGLGVNFFFMLSGFVLAWSWRPGVSSPVFYGRRVARVWPSHAVTWVAFLLASIAVVSLRPSVAGALSGVVLLQSWTKSTAFAVNPVAWTLSCEAFFYLMFPPAWALVRRLSPQALLGAALVVGCVPFALSVLVHDRFFVTTFPPSRLWEFLLGLMLARAVRMGWIRRVPPVWCSVVLLALVVAANSLVRHQVFAVAAEMVPFAGIIVGGALSDLRGRTGWLHSPAAQAAGRASFAFYLVHVLAIELVDDRYGRHAFGWPASLAWSALLLAVACGLAAALHLLVEQPAERTLRARWSPAPRPAVATGIE